MSGKPFLFDNNMFDDKNIAIIDEEEANARLEFTRDEMEAERKKYYEKGKNDGLIESEKGISKAILTLLQKIDRDTSVLFASENDRLKEYEIESVNLSLSIVQKLFPLYLEKYGDEELKLSITKSISENNIPEKIKIELHSDILENLTKHMKDLGDSLNKKISMISNNNLDKNECRILWSSGGIVCNRNLIAEKTFSIMKETLADHSISVHDSEKSSDDVEEIESKNNQVAGDT